MRVNEVRKVLEKAEGFEWDKGNVGKSLAKHGITTKESEEVFFNKPLLTSFDKKHLQIEKRLQALGKTNRKRKLFIAFTIRKNKIRIISARRQNKKERTKYEKG